MKYFIGSICLFLATLLPYPLRMPTPLEIRKAERFIGMPTPYVDVYVAQASAGSNNGSSCGNALVATFLNTAGNYGSGLNQIAPDTTVHTCGTISSTITVAGSGSSGHPIIFKFETGSKISQALCAFTGCLNFDGKTDWTIDGGGTGSVPLGTFVSNGLLENTASGSSLANTNPTTYGISASGVNRFTVQNFLCQNIYVMIANAPTHISDASTARCISYSGSNIEIKNSIFHDAGWNLVNFYGSGNANVSVHDSEIYNSGHDMAIGTSAAVSVTGFSIYNMKIHDSSNWAVAGCGGIHDDGIHFFSTNGVTLGNSIDNVSVHDNYFYGPWGTCPTAHIFVEGGTDRANIVNGYFYNNVSVIPSGATTANGWQEIFSGTGSITYLHNSIIGPGTADITFSINIGSVNNLRSEGNVSTKSGGSVNYGSLTGTVIIDYNFYDTQCQSGNCFVWNGSFKGSLGNFKTACSCDAHAQQSATPLLNADGSPQAGSPVIGVGSNFTSLATGLLAGLVLDTSLGGSRTQLNRPGGATPWDIGAYQFGASASIASTPNPLAFGNQVVSTTSSGLTVTVTNSGGATETLNTPFFTITQPGSEFVRTGGSCSNGGTIASGGGTCTVIITFTPSTTGPRSGTLNINGTASTTSSLTGTGTSSTNPAPVNQLQVIASPPIVQPTITYLSVGACTTACPLIISCINCSASSVVYLNNKPAQAVYTPGILTTSIPASGTFMVQLSNPGPGPISLSRRKK